MTGVMELLELPQQALGTIRAMKQSINAQPGRKDEDNGSDGIFLLVGWRDKEAVFYASEQTNKLPHAEKERALAEHKAITDMAVNEVNHHIIKGSDR